MELILSQTGFCCFFFKRKHLQFSYFEYKMYLCRSIRSLIAAFQNFENLSHKLPLLPNVLRIPITHQLHHWREHRYREPVALRGSTSVTKIISNIRIYFSLFYLTSISSLPSILFLLIPVSRIYLLCLLHLYPILSWFYLRLIISSISYLYFILSIYYFKYLSSTRCKVYSLKHCIDT